MPNRPAAFKQSDLTKALKAALAAGLKPSRIEIEPSTGRIIIIMHDETRAELPSAEGRSSRREIIL